MGVLNPVYLGFSRGRHVCSHLLGQFDKLESFEAGVVLPYALHPLGVHVDGATSICGISHLYFVLGQASRVMCVHLRARASHIE